MAGSFSRDHDRDPPTPSHARITASLFSLAILVYFVAWIAGFVFIARVFGPTGALLLSLVLIFPLIVAVRLRRRWPAVRRSEFILLLILSAVSSGGGVFVVRDWFDTGMDDRHTEDLMFAEFGRRLREEPAFRGVEVRLTESKHIYWVDGEVASKADLDRLRALARQCGITGPLEGPYQNSVSLRVRGSK